LKARRFELLEIAKKGECSPRIPPIPDAIEAPRFEPMRSRLTPNSIDSLSSCARAAALPNCSVTTSHSAMVRKWIRQVAEDGASGEDLARDPRRATRAASLVSTRPTSGPRSGIELCLSTERGSAMKYVLPALLAFALGCGGRVSHDGSGNLPASSGSGSSGAVSSGGGSDSSASRGSASSGGQVDGGISLACMDGTRCGNGQVCCATVTLSAGFSVTSACQAGPCAAGAYQFCATASECFCGAACQPNQLGMGPMICAGGGGTSGGSGSSSTSGTSRRNDAGQWTCANANDCPVSGDCCLCGVCFNTLQCSQ
jgi:hypothetical protein